jgi:hypothetical protein
MSGLRGLRRRGWMTAAGPKPVTQSYAAIFPITRHSGFLSGSQCGALVGARCGIRRHHGVEG